jgi:hypothetical protein
LLARAVDVPGVETHVWRTVGGTVGARLRFSSSGKPTPIDAELGWYDGATGKVGHAKLSQMEPFHVGGYVDASVAFVTGGLLFMPRKAGAPLYLAHVDGSVDAIPRPPGVGVIYGAIQVGGRLLLLDGESTEGVDSLRASRVSSSDDLGKKWISTVWSASGNLALAGGAPFFVLQSEGAPLAWLPLGVLAPELPPWRAARVDTRDPLAACPGPAPDDTTLQEVAGGVEIELRPRSGRGETLTLGSATRVVRDARDGTRCTVSLTVTGGGATAVVAPHDLANGYLFRSDGGKTYSSALTCAPR